MANLVGGDVSQVEAAGQSRGGGGGPGDAAVGGADGAPGRRGQELLRLEEVMEVTWSARPGAPSTSTSSTVWWCL